MKSLRETVATWACKKAVKAHGRPALLRLTRDELARRFGRPGAPPL